MTEQELRKLCDALADFIIEAAPVRAATGSGVTHGEHILAWMKARPEIETTDAKCKDCYYFIRPNRYCRGLCRRLCRMCSKSLYREPRPEDTCEHWRRIN